MDPELKRLLQNLFDGEDNTGCTDDLTVVELSAVDALRDWYDKHKEKPD